MSEVINLFLPHIIRVRAKWYRLGHDGIIHKECRSFTIDRQNVTFDWLRIITARTFNIKGEFLVAYRKKQSGLCHIASDGDLNRALAEASNPHLNLVIKSLPDENALSDWDIIGPGDIPLTNPNGNENYHNRERKSIVGTIIYQMEKTMVRMTRAFSFESSPEGNCEKLPMTTSEFERFFDENGCLVRPQDLHLTVYRGGVDSSIRPEVWKHLLNVYPKYMTADDRDSYLKDKASEYYKLRNDWQKKMNEGYVSDHLITVTNLIHKDVRRTDRSLKFFSGADDNENVQALFNVLTTFAMTHPSVSYCQGMSDLLSPILYVMKDEASSYLCFCGLLKRLIVNFNSDGRSMKTKFKHLRKMLCYYDRKLYIYLKEQCATNMLFCYRWFLLELKREFAYTDSLHMLEVLWASLPPKPPDGNGLQLYEAEYIQTNQKQQPKDDLIWINNHFSSSPALMKKEPSLPRNICGGNEKINIMRNLLAHGSSENGDEITLPIYYRKRKHRSYTTGKLSCIEMPDTSTETETEISSKSNDIDNINICQSYAYGEDFEKNPIKTIAAVLAAKDFLRTQWCYSNTINEIQLNNWLHGKWRDNDGSAKLDTIFNTILSDIHERKRRSGSSNSSSNCEEFSDSECQNNNSSPSTTNRTDRSTSEGYISDSNSSFKEEEEEEDSGNEYDSEDDFDGDSFNGILLDSMVGKKYEEALTYFSRKKDLLPPPHLLGDGNPFMLFLCVSMITQHRSKIIRNCMDINELCVFFDKMVRKHSLGTVLSRARKMFEEYLNMGWSEEQNETDDDDEVFE